MDFWYRPFKTWQAWLLLPFSWIFRGIVALRRKCYEKGLLSVYHAPKPVIVVGNISVGGTGKTPLVIGLVEYLKKEGYSPGIVSRGYGGKVSSPLQVRMGGDGLVAEVGDEALLLAKRANCPVVIGRDRPKAVELLLQETDCDIVISDDGLQHYRLHRDIEIAVVDGKRQFGNGCLLPAGPLREPEARLKNVDFIIYNGVATTSSYAPSPSSRGLSAGSRAVELSMQLIGDQFISIFDETKQVPIQQFAHQKIHAVAGIGNPERFFDDLRRYGFEVIPHSFPDHYAYKAKDFLFEDGFPIVMTEKDAVKCDVFADERFWYLPVRAEVGGGFECFISRLNQRA